MTTNLDKTKSYTVEEFMELPDDGKRYELIEGKLIEIDGEGEQEESVFNNLNHGRIITRLIGFMYNYLTEQEKTVGEVLTQVTFELAPHITTIPDIAFVKAEKLFGADPEKVFPGSPDLAVEVLSPNDTWSVIIGKVRLYQRYQVKLIWVVDPFDQSVFIFRPNQPRRWLFVGDELSGENVLPGFTLAVKRLFE